MIALFLTSTAAYFYFYLTILFHLHLTFPEILTSIPKSLKHEKNFHDKGTFIQKQILQGIYLINYLIDDKERNVYVDLI